MLKISLQASRLAQHYSIVCENASLKVHILHFPLEVVTLCGHLTLLFENQGISSRMLVATCKQATEAIDIYFLTHEIFNHKFIA